MTDKRASELLADNLTAVYGYAFSRLYNKDKVDELASEIVYEVITSAPNLRNEAAFWGFVWRIADNTFRRFIRREELAAEVAELTDDVAGNSLDVCVLSPEQEYIERETESREIYLLRRELSLMKKAHREVCVAYYVDNKSCSQIAKEQNISVEMVKYHLFKTRKLLKEGIGMTRTLGEKSYNPGTFRLNFWGDRNRYDGLFRRKLPGSIMLAAYRAPLTAEELSVELGVSMPYLEDELEILETAGLIRRTGEKYQTNIVIITSEYEDEFVKDTSGVYAAVADSVFEKAVALLPQVRAFDFYGRDYGDDRLLFCLLNLAFVRAYIAARKRSPFGEPCALARGGHGWLYGHDYDAAKHSHFRGIAMESWNKEFTAWFSAENYSVLEASSPMFDHFDFENKIAAMCDAILGKPANRENPVLPWLIEHGFIICRDNRLSANFPVFRDEVFREVCSLLSPIIDKVTDCMLKISDMAERAFAKRVPAALVGQCGDIAKIHHRLDVMAFLFETLISEKKLTPPTPGVPLCLWGVIA